MTQANCSKSKQTRGQPLGRGHNTVKILVWKYIEVMNISTLSVSPELWTHNTLEPLWGIIFAHNKLKKEERIICFDWWEIWSRVLLPVFFKSVQNWTHSTDQLIFRTVLWSRQPHPLFLYISGNWFKLEAAINLAKVRCYSSEHRQIVFSPQANSLLALHFQLPT